MSTKVKVLADKAALAREAADQFVALAGQAIERSGRFTVALAGGSTPKDLYALLASDPYREQVSWENVMVFFGDERCVPPDHADSNYRMAKESLLDLVAIPEEQVFRVHGELVPAEAATAYEDDVRIVFSPPAGEMPEFDCILLGIGDDGHTASLFPHTEALQERRRMICANPVPQMNTVRVTFSAPLILNAAQVTVLASGEGKAPAVARAIECELNIAETPSQLLREARGQVTWLLDQDAASNLADGAIS